MVWQFVFAQATALSFADASEVSGRLQGDEVRWDASTTPGVRLRVRTPRTGYSLRYAPSITALSLGEPEYEVVVFHTAQATASLRFRRHSLRLNQSLRYGERNFRFDVSPDVEAPEPEQEPTGAPEPDEPEELPPGQIGTVNQVVQFGNSSTSLGAAHVVSRRIVLSETVGYSISGGVGEESQQVYPLQRRIRGGASLGYLASRRDTLTTRLAGQQIYTDPDAVATIMVLQENWTRSLLADTRLSLGAGVSYIRVESESAETTEDVGFGPTGAASLVQRWIADRTRYSLTLSAGARPAVDRFTGGVDTRIFWGVALARVRRPLALVAAARGAHSVEQDSDNTLSSYGVSLGAVLSLSPEFDLRAGVSTSTQSLGPSLGLEEEERFLWRGFIGFIYRPQEIRF